MVKNKKSKPAKQATGPKKQARRRRRHARGARLSRGGEDFLKCAFAPVDFQQGEFEGIPDVDTSRSIGLHFERNTTVIIPAKTTQTFILMPSPGVAWYWYDQKTKHVVARTYPTSKQVFGRYGSEYVTDFRFASNVMEVTCVTDVLSMGGSIQVYEVPIKLGTQNSQSGTLVEGYDRQAVLGIAAALNPQSSPRSYVGHVRDGAYLVTANSAPTFEWSGLITGVQEAAKQGDWKMDTDAGADVKVATDSGDDYALRGLGSFNSKVVRITAGDKDQVFNFKAMQCVEFKPTPGSLLSRLATPSADYDPVALAEYRKVVAALPIAVTVKENSKFWDWVVRTARGAAAMLSHVPGPVGLIASGVSTLIS